jgi:hypothetical protein
MRKCSALEKTLLQNAWWVLMNQPGRFVCAPVICDKTNWTIAGT